MTIPPVLQARLRTTGERLFQASSENRRSVRAVSWAPDVGAVTEMSNVVAATTIMNMAPFC